MVLYFPAQPLQHPRTLHTPFRQSHLSNLYRRATIWLTINLCIGTQRQYTTMDPLLTSMCFTKCLLAAMLFVFGRVWPGHYHTNHTGQRICQPRYAPATTRIYYIKGSSKSSSSLIWQLAGSLPVYKQSGSKQPCTSTLYSSDACSQLPRTGPPLIQLCMQMHWRWCRILPTMPQQDGVYA